MKDYRELVSTPQQVEDFLQRVADWASKQPEVLSLALAGSYARNQAGETSDVDLILVAADPDELLLKPGWIETFDRVRQVQIEHYGKVTSLRAWYLYGLEVEFGLTGREWASQPLDPGTRQVFEDGLRVLYEREILLSNWTGR